LNAARLLLHARKLTIQHPVTGKGLTFTAELEGDINCLFETFKWTPQD